MMMAKGGWGKGQGRRGKDMIGAAKKKDKSLVVWIGGLKETDKKDQDLNKKLQELINKKAEGCKFVDIGRKGSGAAIFGSEEDASNAISILNGTKFKGQC